MGFVNPRMSVDLSALDDQISRVKGAEKRMATLQRQRVPASRGRVRQLSSSPENLPTLPFMFVTEKSRRWYFANKVPKGRKGKGRYKRTGKLARSTNVSFYKVQSGGVFQFETDAPAWEFVNGDRQNPSHKLTGHKTENEILSTEAARLEKQIIEDWFFVNSGDRR